MAGVWSILFFSDLSVGQLHDLLTLRSQVFVVEQKCIYNDLDEIDLQSHHLLFHDDKGHLRATARIVPAGLRFETVSIGRIVVDEAFRNRGLGLLIMQWCHRFIADRYRPSSISLSAQYHLISFYKTHHYEVVSKPYDEDGIKHVKMKRLADQ